MINDEKDGVHILLLILTFVEKFKRVHSLFQRLIHYYNIPQVLVENLYHFALSTSSKQISKTLPNFDSSSVIPQRKSISVSKDKFLVRTFFYSNPNGYFSLNFCLDV